MLPDFKIEACKILGLDHFKLYFRGVLVATHTTEQMAKTQAMRLVNKVRNV